VHVIAALRSVGSQSEDSPDGGFTLVELMVSLTITAMALTLVLPILTTVTTVISSTDSSSNASGYARDALLQLSSDLGSANFGNVCFPTTAQALVIGPCQYPDSGTTSGSTVRVLSNVNNSCEWIQWSVDPSTTDSTAGWLLQQSWVNGATSAAAAGPVVGPLANDFATQPLFTLDTSNFVIHVQLYLKGSIGNAPSAANHSAQSGSQSVFVQTSVTLVQSSQPVGSC